jgi:PAS domain S-box-containing protein
MPGSTENLYSLMVADHITAMLAYWDKDLVCRFANKAYLDWFGVSKEQMINKMKINELLGPLYEKNKPYIEEALKGHNQTFERQIPLPNGSIRYSLANYFPDIINGKVNGFFVHVADITPVKVLELELLKSNETINEQNKRLLNFANIVTHNLKSFAGNFKTSIEILDTAESESEMREMIDTLKNLSGGFRNTINHLTEIVQTQNISTLSKEKLYLRSYIENVLIAIQIDVKSTKVTIQNNVGADIIVLANPAYLESIIINFLTNAIKYRSPYRDPIIELNTAIADNNLIFSIKDNGLGIDLEKFGNSLFGMYKTFHSNPDAKGIGLYLVKSQIESMGWHIEVESQVNVGTTFSIYIPISFPPIYN